MGEVRWPIIPAIRDMTSISFVGASVLLRVVKTYAHENAKSIITSHGRCAIAKKRAPVRMHTYDTGSVEFGIVVK